MRMYNCLTTFLKTLNRVEGTLITEAGLTAGKEKENPTG